MSHPFDGHNDDPESGCEATIKRFDHEIAMLADVLLGEFGGPDRPESAAEMAIRLLREQRATIEVLKTTNTELGEEVQNWVAEYGRLKADANANILSLQRDLAPSRIKRAEVFAVLQASIDAKEAEGKDATAIRALLDEAREKFPNG